MDEKVKEIIRTLGLTPLEFEGGFYRETYRSKEKLANGRDLSTSIYYLLTSEDFSRLHKLASDEIFHFYLGDEAELFTLYEDGTADTIYLGQDIQNGSRLQFVVPKDTWQAMRIKVGGSFALMGSTMSPGFDYTDFTDGRDHIDELLLKYPRHKELILQYAGLL
jgi:uncharacterized protein